MKKFMLTALCLMMALSVVSCDDDDDDDKAGTVDLAIVNVMDLSGTADTAEAIYVSGASGGGDAIIPGLATFVTLDPKDVFVTGSLNDDETGINDNVATVSLTAGVFRAVYQAQSDNDGDCTEGASGSISCSDDGYETNVSGEITAQYTLAKGGTYVVYFCSLVDDVDGNDDYVMVYEKGADWLFENMTLLDVDSLSCDDTDGDCSNVDEI